MEVPIIIILILILAIILSLIFLIFYIKNKLKRLSNPYTTLGITSLFSLFKNQEIEYSESPKSVSGLDSVLISEINKDFPNINISEIKSTAENAILEYYHSLNDKELKSIPNLTPKLANKIKGNIIDNHSHYTNIKIHRTVINAYDNKKGLCKITLQTSLEYNEELNNTQTKKQDRLNTELIYIYDEKQGNISLNCPNCGAPIKVLGTKSCPYCNTGIVEMLSKTWQIDDIYQK